MGKALFSLLALPFRLVGFLLGSIIKGGLMAFGAVIAFILMVLLLLSL